MCRNRRLVEAAFSVFDKDGDGKVSLEDFSDYFALGDEREVWLRHLPKQLQIIGDKGPDGKYTKEQFVEYVGKRMVVTSGDALMAVG